MNRRVVGAAVASGVVLAGMVGLAPGAFAGVGGGTPTGAIIEHQGLPMPASGNCADLKGTALDTVAAWGTGLSGHWVQSWEPWGGPIYAPGVRTTPVNTSDFTEHWGWACIRTIANYGGGDWFFVGSAEGESPAPPLYYDQPT